MHVTKDIVSLIFESIAVCHVGQYIDPNNNTFFVKLLSPIGTSLKYI